MPFSLFKKKSAPAEPLPVVVPPPAPRPLMIFDFDGTLADNLQHVLGILQKFADSIDFKAEIKTYQDALNLKKFNIKNTALLKHYNSLLSSVTDGLADKITETHLFDGLKDTLKQLHDAGVILAIVTTNREETVAKFMECHEMTREMFACIKGSGAPDKTKLLEEAVKEHAEKGGQVFYVSGRCDYMPTVKSKKIAAKSVGVAWGYDSKEAYSKADYYIKKPDELLKIAIGPSPSIDSAASPPKP